MEKCSLTVEVGSTQFVRQSLEKRRFLVSVCFIMIKVLLLPFWTTVMGIAVYGTGEMVG
jgi:predicted alpha/beta hydrolase